MMGLISLEVFNSIFNITEQKIKFELYTDNYDEFSFKELKIELEDIPLNSDITTSHLQHEVIGRRIIQAFKKYFSKIQALMVILYNCCVMQDLLFEFLKIILEM